MHKKLHLEVRDSSITFTYLENVSEHVIGWRVCCTENIADCEPGDHSCRECCRLNLDVIY